jgi:carbon-monoxide dehydrogenase small subunit
MNTITLTVNGKPVTAAVTPRTHLADFVRETLLLTGTHLGCEHGVCGACTLLIDGAPARSCIAFAAACDGAEVTSIEGLEHDPVIERLRAAFTAEHALQCGYCTPGMLVTARDIVTRLPHADEAAIRLELAGNLCRCTGYAGIVRAIQRVLRENPTPVKQPEPEPVVAPPPIRRAVALPVAAAPALPAGAQVIRQTLRLAVPRDAVWQALHDPTLVAGCVPGARLTAVEGDRVSGELVAALGPIQTRFSGSATLSYRDDDYTGSLRGEGADQRSATRLTGEAAFALHEDGPQATTLELTISYVLRGPLAQLGRASIVREFAGELAATVALALQARLTGAPPPPPSKSLGLGGMLLRVVRNWLRGRFARPSRPEGRPD